MLPSYTLSFDPFKEFHLARITFSDPTVDFWPYPGEIHVPRTVLIPHRLIDQVSVRLTERISAERGTETTGLLV